MSEINGQPVLFEQRMPIYPRSVKGRFRKIKWSVLILAYSVYFILPWLSWQRQTGTDQAVMFDIQGRIFYLFGLIVNPQDIFWLASLLMIGVFFLFFITGIAGRVFCGYFCFQSMWTDVYMWIEHIVQGERPARIRLDKSRWTVNKIARKAITHILWVIVAFITGLTFTLYWGESDQLISRFFSGGAPFPAYATTLFITATTYVMAGLAREQVCTYMCPYARFQSVMFDKDTLIVAYDITRGEGNQGRKKLGAGFKTQQQREQAGVGDCVDCGFCVQVCPTGIDIRDGLQMSCTSCALCIDACNIIMDKLHWPRGLIRYASEREHEGGKTNLFKLKNIGFAFVLLAATFALAWSIVHQGVISMSVTQVRNPLYVVLSDGRLQNSYDIKLNNKSEYPMKIKLSLQGLSGVEIDTGEIHEINMSGLSSVNIYVRLKLTHVDGTKGQVPFDFIVTTTVNGEFIKESKQALFTMHTGADL